MTDLMCTTGEADVLTVLADFLPDAKPLDALLAYRAQGADQPALRLQTRANLARTLGALQRKGMTSKWIVGGKAVYKIMPTGLRAVAGWCAHHGKAVPTAITHALGLFTPAETDRVLPQPVVSYTEREDWAGTGFNGRPAPDPAALHEGERVCTIYDLPGTTPILAIGITTRARLLFGIRHGKGWAFQPEWLGVIAGTADIWQGTLEQARVEQAQIERELHPGKLRRKMLAALAERPQTRAELIALNPGRHEIEARSEIRTMAADMLIILGGGVYELTEKGKLANL